MNKSIQSNPIQSKRERPTGSEQYTVTSILLYWTWHHQELQCSQWDTKIHLRSFNCNGGRESPLKLAMWHSDRYIPNHFTWTACDSYIIVPLSRVRISSFNITNSKQYFASPNLLTIWTALHFNKQWGVHPLQDPPLLLAQRQIEWCSVVISSNNQGRT